VPRRLLIGPIREIVTRAVPPHSAPGSYPGRLGTRDLTGYPSNQVCRTHRALPDVARGGTSRAGTFPDHRRGPDWDIGGTSERGRVGSIETPRGREPERRSVDECVEFHWIPASKIPVVTFLTPLTLDPKLDQRIARPPFRGFYRY
jgi:hypothetical protein